MNRDPWLEPWVPLLHRYPKTAEILELSCGPGHDTWFLAQQGFHRITATDIAPEALTQTSQRVLAATVLHHDLNNPLPFADQRFDVVIASLCLHYFEWEKTLDIVRDIHRCLADDGLLVCRLNSTGDVHYGATGHREISPHYYEVDGQAKRFFDGGEVLSLFSSGWISLSMQERTIGRYEKPKVVWEILLTKDVATLL